VNGRGATVESPTALSRTLSKVFRKSFTQIATGKITGAMSVRSPDSSTSEVIPSLAGIQSLAAQLPKYLILRYCAKSSSLGQSKKRRRTGPRLQRPVKTGKQVSVGLRLPAAIAGPHGAKRRERSVLLSSRCGFSIDLPALRIHNQTNTCQPSMNNCAPTSSSR
jgi:hypothetical protein